MQRSSPILVISAIAVFIFLLGPLVIVAAASVSNSEFLAFPPQGFSLRWFENVFEVSAFRSTFLISLQIATLGTFVSLLIGIPAAYALSRFGVTLPRALANFFVLPILVPEIVFGFSLLSAVSVDFDLPIFPTLLIGHTIIVLPYSIRVVTTLRAMSR